MKRYVAMSMCGAMVVLAMLAVAGVAQADFLITLRSGKKIKVSRYQEEGNQIAYRRFGGKVAIPRSRVAGIENLKTGEKQVFNHFYTAQEKKALRDAQVANLRKLERKQEIRNSGLREPAPQIESPVTKEGKRGGVIERTPEVSNPLCDDWGHCFSMAKCIATGEGASFNMDWWRKSPSERVRNCESGEDSTKFINRVHRSQKKAAREEAQREKALYEEVLRERERVDRAKRLLEKAGQ